MSLKLGFGEQADRRTQAEMLFFSNVALDHIRVETVEEIVGE
jgi:hypothetical protein